MKTIHRLTLWTVALCSLAVAAFSASTVTEGVTVRIQGSSIKQTWQPPHTGQCPAALAALTFTGNQFCRTTYALKKIVEPPPVEPPATGLPPPNPNPYTTLRVRPMEPGEPPPTQGQPWEGGAFRNPCAYSHLLNDDPIVSPGQVGASHLHLYFGNTGLNANSTQASLLANKAGTCAGGIANLSSYWVPAMLDSNGKPILPLESLFYYKCGENGPPCSVTQALPAGLKTISGNLMGTSGPSWMSRHRYECNSEYSTGSEALDIPCPVGGYILVKMQYQNCSDGRLDSPDHRSHMAHSDGQPCPPSHPIALPTVSLNIKYPIAAGQDPRKWRLSSDMYPTSIPGGYSMHADAWYNWDPAIQDAWLNNCLRANRDGHGYLLCDGRATY